ncbi:MAG: hypothetical protein WC070_01170 [Candidatus Magasanikbacteria bacterium]
MKHKNIVEVIDFNQDEWKKLINLSLKYKKNKNLTPKKLNKKRIGLLFDNNSLRTRLSFETAIYLLGGDSYFVDIHNLTHEKDGTPRESYEDIIETADRMLDAYVLRDYSQKMLEVFKRKNNPPFINGFCQIGHPSQALADLSVIKWKKKKYNDLNYVCVCPSKGSGVMESFIYAVLLLGQKISVITETGKFIGKNKDFWEQANKLIKKYNGNITITKNLTETIKQADVLYVDEWWEDNKNYLKKNIGKYKIDINALLGNKKDLVIMHCLPAHYDREITKEVIYSPQSIILDQAEFRVYSAMSLLNYLVS